MESTQQQVKRLLNLVIVLSLIVIALSGLLWWTSIPHDPPKDPFDERLCNLYENGDYILQDGRWQCINNGFFS